VAHAIERFGAIDVLAAVHAHSADGTLDTVTAADLDRAWAVNARATVLLAQAFAAHHDDTRPDGRLVLFTSGQHLGPMSGELPYAISKGAIHQMTRSLADALADRGITVNAVNPGPSTRAGRPRSCASACGPRSPPGAGAGPTTSPPSSAGWRRPTARG
jgi:3-oxoacyl-[acyl-carrier protein] reductase